MKCKSGSILALLLLLLAAAPAHFVVASSAASASKHSSRSSHSRLRPAAVSLAVQGSTAEVSQYVYVEKKKISASSSASATASSQSEEEDGGVSASAGSQSGGTKQLRQQNQQEEQQQQKQQRRQSQILARLWSGEDVHEDELALLDVDDINSSSPSEIDAVNASQGQTIPVQIFGLFDSGTNLLRTLMKKNFGAKVSFPSPIWKHASLRRYQAEHPEKQESLSELVAVAMVRNPVSWLQSLRNAPYDVRPCINRAQWLTEACHFHVLEKQWNLTDFDLSNIEQWWNDNTEDYTELSTFGFKRGLVLRYEDLVMDTEGSIAKMAEVLGLEKPRAFQQVYDPAKDHGDPVSRDDAIAKIQDKSYLALYSDGESGERLRDACERLDHRLEERFNYSDCNLQPSAMVNVSSSSVKLSSSSSQSVDEPEQSMTMSMWSWLEMAWR